MVLRLGIVLLVSLSGLVSPAPAASPADVDFEELAQRWLSARDLSPAAGEGIDIERILEEQFLRCQLGLFDVRIPPRALQDPAWRKEIGRVLESLLDLQETWILWLSDSEKLEPARAKEIKALRGWVRAWKPQQLAKIDPGQAVRAIDALAPKEPVQLAHASFAEYMLASGPLGLGEKKVPPARLVLLPERADFVEFAALLGLASPRHRPFFWDPGVLQWCYLDFNGMRMLALQFAARGAKDYRLGISMSDRNPKAMAEHAVQVGARALLEASFGGRVEPMLAAGFANNMVIGIFNEVDTRTDGDVSSRTTQARSVFIPGGNPNGGVLPPNSANSRWRETMGKDQFVKVLRRAQKAGAKEMSSRETKHLGFELVAEGGGDRLVVRAPFLGPKASDEPLPGPKFTGDHLEFLRAYRSAFLHWLREHAAGGKKPSHAAFGQLLRQFATSGPTSSLPAALTAVYGVPLSATEPGKDCLEGQFLLWLSKQR